MAQDWLKRASKTFKASRGDAPGWFLQEHRGRLRLKSTAFPPRPGEPADPVIQSRVLPLSTLPSPANEFALVSEAMAVFEAVTAGNWCWPSGESLPHALEGEHINRETIGRAIELYRDHQLGEKLAGPRTWKKHAYTRRRALEVAEAGHTTNEGYLKAALQLYGANSAARLQLFDLLRAVWEHAGWDWPKALKPLRGNGKAVAPPEGVLAASDEAIHELRARLDQGLNRIGARKTPPSRSVEFDLLICFGLRPQELQGLALTNEGGQLLAHVSRIKKSGRGQTKPRVVPAVPPSVAGADCWGLWERWQRFGLSAGTETNEDPGHRLTELFCRLRKQPAVLHELPEGLRLYGLRHAFALRLGIELALTVREAAELMGHSPSTHLNTYGRQLDAPRLQAKVGALVRKRANEHYRMVISET